MIGAIPRALIVGLAAVFSGYQLVLGLVSIGMARHYSTYLAAMVLYAIATVLSLSFIRRERLPIWIAIFAFVTTVVVPILVTSQLPRGIDNGYAVWHTTAIGALMVIVSARHQHFFAWAGISAMVVQTFLWAGAEGLLAYGVLGTVAWVTVAHSLSISLTRWGRDTRRYALAEREAVQWCAAQEAHLSERQFRFSQTSRISIPMLRRIVAVAGDLTDDQRRECLYLEAAIRDEIRGRKLLNDRVREQIMAIRRIGTVVILLDEGGIDDLQDTELERVRNRLADAIHDTQAGRLIVRTAPGGSDVAITVVGLSSQGGGSASALGGNGLTNEEENDDRVDLWLEIPRSVR